MSLVPKAHNSECQNLPQFRYVPLQANMTVTSIAVHDSYKTYNYICYLII